MPKTLTRAATVKQLEDELSEALDALERLSNWVHAGHVHFNDSRLQADALRECARAKEVLERLRNAS